jgi:amidohydrolase
MGQWRSHLEQAIERQIPDMIALRRHMHRNPEPSGEEHRTSMHLYQILDQLGYHVRLGPEGCGVLADMPGWAERPESLLAIRCDIDALRIQDEKTVDYRSRCPGIMHACGHDAHSSIAIGALSAIAELQRDGHLPFRLRIRGVFQPAEETCEGAKLMISAGALDQVEAIIALHVDPSRRVGRVGLRSGVITANCDEMIITVHGRGGHAARPHETRDPISAAAQLLNWLYLQIPRSTDSRDSVVFTIGRVVGGHNANVIPETVELRGTLRTLDRQVREKSIATIRRLVTAVADGTQTKIQVQFGIEARSVVNDRALIDLIESATISALGPDAVELIQQPSMGSEDFSFYGDEVPLAMFRLGCISDQFGGAGLHSPIFDVDEQSLAVGSRIIAETVLAWCEEKSEKKNPC